MSPVSSPFPIQFAPFEKKHFETDEGLAFVNLQFSQIITALNTGNGVAGKVTLPHGVDVRGATVSGLGEPEAPEDAVSQSHVQSNYSAPAVGPQLDIGGKYALKGLTGLQLQLNSLLSSLSAGVSGTIALTKLTGGGSDGSITVVNGLITAFVNPT